MGRIYRVPYTGTVTAAGADADLVSILPADDKPVKLIGWFIGQTTEVADAAEEGLRITVRHMAATVTIGSGGSAVTPVPCPRPTATAAGFTARCNDSTVSTTTGTSTVVEELAWINRNTPWERYIPDEKGLRLEAVQGEALIVRLETTLADDMTVAMTFLFEEEG